MLVCGKCKVGSQIGLGENYNSQTEQRHRWDLWLLQQSGTGRQSGFIGFPRKQNSRHFIFKCLTRDMLSDVMKPRLSTGCERNVGSANTRRRGLSVRKNCSTWLRKESLCLDVIQFQFVLYHPGLHTRDAYNLHGQGSDLYLIRRTGLK